MFERGSARGGPHGVGVPTSRSERGGEKSTRHFTLRRFPLRHLTSRATRHVSRDASCHSPPVAAVDGDAGVVGFVLVVVAAAASE